MKYSKPELSILGTASAVIEYVPSKIGTGMEFPYLSGNPAYDLDE